MDGGRDSGVSAEKAACDTTSLARRSQKSPSLQLMHVTTKLKLNASDITALYEEHANTILKFAMRRTFDAQISVDIVGETFAVAFDKREKYRGTTDAEVQSLLFGIASNLVKMYFRSGAIERRAMEKLGVDQTTVP